MLATAITFNALLLAPELRIGRLPLNDVVFHLTASERLGESLARGEPFLDPWVSEWALGYPVWRSYQPLPHLLAAAALWLSQGLASAAAAFAALQYGLLVLLPASVYGGARLVGLCPAAAGLASVLILAPSAAGDLDRYGLSYGATVWRGTGLYTQLVALHVLAWTLGLVACAVDRGRGRALAAASLAATALSHLVFGYVAFASGVLLAVVGPPGERSRRLARLSTIVMLAILLLAWFVVPFWLGRHEVAHSRWEPGYKWDSFGARVIGTELLTGRLLDSRRVPVLTLFLLVGGVGAVLSLRAALPRRLLALTGVWLALFFGRATWGRLLLLAGIPADLHVHRFQAAFELSAVLLAAWGVVHALRTLSLRHRGLAMAGAALVVVGFVPIAAERARYLEESRAWGEASLLAFERERPDLEAALADVRTILAERPGRVFSGRRGTWGDQLTVGAVPVYAFLSLAHLDQVSFLYHAMSRTSDVMMLRDERDPAHDAAFGVRAVVAPAAMPMPAHLRLRGTHGRFAVYEASPEGYFGVVDVRARYVGPASGAYEASAEWLRSPLVRSGVVAALDVDVPGAVAFGPGESLAALASMTTSGRVVSETKDGETYRARLVLSAPGYALAKLTWDPGLVARVDGVETRMLRVTPGFGAVPVPAGEHEVVVRYEPGPIRPLLLVIGLVLFAACTWASRTRRAAVAEDIATSWVAAAGRRPLSAAVLAGVFATAALVFGPRKFFGVDGAPVERDLDERGGAAGEAPDPFAEAVLALAQAGKLQSALDLLARRARDAPGEAAARYYQAGKALWDRGDKQTALSIWESGANLLPQEVSLRRNVALCRYHLRDYEGAVHEFQRALELRPDDTVIRTDLAWALLELGRFEAARALSVEVLKVKPDDEAAKAILARVAAARGK